MKQNPDLSEFFLAASVITKQTEQAFRAFYAALTVALRKTMTAEEWSRSWNFSEGTDAPAKANLAGVTRENIQRGGIIGSVEIYDCVTTSCSEWFIGSYGFLLRKPRPLPFTPWRGQPGFFDVPVEELPHV
jgi:hypothetical protein